MNNDMVFYGKKICFIGAHPDDIELGCGALIAGITSITEVLCLTLSDNQINPELPDLIKEHRRSMAVLGVRAENVLVGQFETRRFPQSRQEILEFLIELNLKHRPDIIFVHTKADIHQDHNTTTEEVLRAFRGTTVLGFDGIRSSYGFYPRLLVEVTEKDVDMKIRALAEYKTYQSKYYFNPELTRATLIQHGSLAGRHFAEGFDILRIIGVFSSKYS